MCTCVEFKIPPTNGVAAIKINRKNSYIATKLKMNVTMVIV